MVLFDATQQTHFVEVDSVSDFQFVVFVIIIVDQVTMNYIQKLSNKYCDYGHNVFYKEPLIELQWMNQHCHSLVAFTNLLQNIVIQSHIRIPIQMQVAAVLAIYKTPVNYYM